MANDYKSIFIPKRVVFIVNQQGAAFVADSENAKTIETGRNWASGYINWQNREKYIPEEITYDNGDFIVKVDSAAGHSWNGGKLSFWSCIIKCPDGREFKVGINSELLCELICYNTFVNGECQEKVLFGTQHGQYGMYTKNMPSYQDYLNSSKLRDDMKTSQTVKYKPGDVVRTLTDSSVYIGTIYKYFDLERTYNGWNHSTYTITIYEKPKLLHVFANKYNGEWHMYSYRFLNKKPKRMLTGETEDVTNVISNWLQDEVNRYKENMEKGIQSYYIESFVQDIQFGLSESVADIKQKLKERINTVFPPAGTDSPFSMNYTKRPDLEFVCAE